MVPRTNRLQSAFTLIELLIVIGVIATLASILLPAVNSARQQGYSIQCLNNERAIMAASLAYAGENNNFLPFTGWGSNGTPPQPSNWLYNPHNPSVNAAAYKASDVKTGLLWHYMPNITVYRCPLDLANPNLQTLLQATTSYIMNGCASNLSTNGGLSFPVTSFHSSDILFWEFPDVTAESGGSTQDASNYPYEGVACRHHNQTTAGFVDGHAELISDGQFNFWCQASANNPVPNPLWCDPIKPNGAFAAALSNPVPTSY